MTGFKMDASFRFWSEEVVKPVARRWCEGNRGKSEPARQRILIGPDMFAGCSRANLPFRVFKFQARSPQDLNPLQGLP